ncbi:MAG: chromosome segregation protein SMC, partial [Sorangium cellulosum]
EALVHAVAGDALLVVDHDVAQRMRAEGIRRTLVTLEGTVYHADGRISGGMGDDVAAGLLQQKIQLREVSLQSRQQEAQVASLYEHHAELRNQMNETGQLLDEARAFEREVELEKVNLDAELRRAEDQIESVRRRLDEISNESDELDTKMDETALERNEAERKLNQTKSETSAASEELRKAEQDATAWAQQVSDQKEACTEKRIEFARAREQANAGRATQERLGRSIDELTNRADELEQTVVESAIEQGRLAATLFGLKARMLDAAEAAEKAHLEFDRRRQSLENARNALALHEAEIKTLRDTFDANIERQRGHEMALQRLGLEREHLLEAIAEKFRGLHLPSVVGDFHLRPPPDDEHRNRIEELTRLIERMGSVNLEAMAEYEQASERYTFYTTQKEDLDKALGDLERAIQQMNRESRRLFRSTFDSVNERFQQVFP